MVVIIVTAWIVLGAVSALVFAAVCRAGLAEDRDLGYLPLGAEEPQVTSRFVGAAR